MPNDNRITLLDSINNSLMRGDMSILTTKNICSMNNIAMSILTNKNNLDQVQIICLGLIIRISNIIYNNSSRELLPLDDGIYDLLLVVYKQYNPNYIVGAPPVDFSEGPIISSMIENPVIIPAIVMDKEYVDNSFYLNQENLLQIPTRTKEDFLFNPAYFVKEVSKKTVSVPHVYPKLVGTLDKCKFVLNRQAADRGVLDDPNVQVFERDFLGKHLQMGLFDINTIITLVAELKYDGISVEGEVTNRVISARSRGDANADIAADLTPIFEGYNFPHAPNIPEEEMFGMKFEAIINSYNLEILSMMRGKTYKNARNAVIGLTGANDGYVYRDLITLVPLATSMEGISRIEELEFMNKYYHTGEKLRYSIISGNYIEVLYKINRFVEEAEYLRPFLPFMYDGVVVSYVDPKIVNLLGRENSVNKYSMAIKFNALKKETIFNGYTFTIGQSGVVTPMIHFNPVEFYGTVHDKASGHSYERFMNLGLRPGDIISVEYQHDVMAYITKPSNSHNDANTNPMVPFTDTCPSCGNQIKLSPSGKSALCDNIKCPERNISRMVNMIQKLNLKDFSEETLKQIAKYSLNELLSLERKDIMFLGEVNSQKFIDRMNELKSIPIPDYKIVGAIGFSNIAIEKWKTILNKIPLENIVFGNEDQLKVDLIGIKGIGASTVDVICTEREFFMDDLITILSMRNITRTTGSKLSKTVRYSGIRDAEVTKTLTDMGIDVNEVAGVTKNTDILLVPYAGYTSRKTEAVGPNTLIIPINDFKMNMTQYL